jgi:DNA-binding response OmpR family regulator
MLKILIAEDDWMIAEYLKEILTQNGYEVVGIARTVAEAVTLSLTHKPDLAVLDLYLADGGLGTEIVVRLKDTKLGVLYAAADPSKLTAADGHAYLQKPYRYDDLLRSLEVVGDILATGRANPPLPIALSVLRPAA